MAGRLRHRVTVERRSEALDELGQRNNVWTAIATAWAKVRPLSGREFLSASGVRAEITHEITMRYPIDVKPKDRVLFGLRLFDIDSVFTVDERNRYVIARAIENNDA
jgi:SPP1 family predicted phage head-tail adaptor